MLSLMMLMLDLSATAAQNGAVNVTSPAPQAQTMGEVVKDSLGKVPVAKGAGSDLSLKATKSALVHSVLDSAKPASALEAVAMNPAQDLKLQAQDPKDLFRPCMARFSQAKLAQELTALDYQGFMQSCQHKVVLGSNYGANLAQMGKSVPSKPNP